MLFFSFSIAFFSWSGSWTLFLIIGSTSINDLGTLKRLSFLFFVLAGFFALPDLIGFLKGDPTAPLPVIILGLVTMGLFYYGSKKGIA